MEKCFFKDLVLLFEGVGNMQQIINNRYLIIQQLGRGGFGDTYLAEDTHLPSRPYCVIKQLRPIINNPHTYQLVQKFFQHEAVILEDLGNSNNRIPHLYAYFAEQGLFYLVQEYIQGQTLTQLVETYGTINEIAVREILNKLLYVLNFVHSRGVIHRDIKPDNVILRKSDNMPVLIDFGAVRESVGTQFNTQGHAVKSEIIGTQGFMPPEQAMGKPVFSSDLYAVGVTMIYLLTGKNPLELQTDVQTGAIIWHPYAINVSAGLKMLLDKATAYHTSARYTNAKEMINALLSLNSIGGVDPTIPIVINEVETIQIPPEIRGWNWGAFLLPGFWSLPNQVWIGLLCWMPFVNIIMRFVVGARGNVWAWQSRKWRSVTDFKANQRGWAIAGASVWAGMLSLFVLLGFIGIMTDDGKPEPQQTPTPALTTSPSSSL